MIPAQFNNNEFYYRSLPQDRLIKLAKEFDSNFERFKEKFSKFLNEYQGKIRVNYTMLYRIFERIDQRRDYYRYFHSTSPDHPMIMSQTKETALFAYWILKYKPLSFEDVVMDEQFFGRTSYTLNELYAAFLLMTFITGMDDGNQKFFSHKTLPELTYSLINRDISKEALILYVESFRPSEKGEADGVAD